MLDLGCGRAKTPGAIGADRSPRSDADLLFDLDRFPYPFADSSFTQVICRNVLEHVDNVVRVLEEIYRICRPGALLSISTPHFSSVDAFTDPTHRHYFASRSFDYFTGEFPEYSFYSSARFRRRSVRIEFWPLPRLGGLRPQHLLGAHLLAAHAPLVYERFFAFLLPAQSIHFELEVLKP